jgi:chromosome segregation ATPase
MSLMIETDLKDILNGLSQRFDKLDQKLDVMQKDITDLKLGQSEIKGEVKNLGTEVKGEIKTLDEKLSGQITILDEKLGGKVNTLDTKVDGISTRISNQEFLLRTIVGGLVLIILSGAIRMFWNFPVNP